MKRLKKLLATSSDETVQSSNSVREYSSDTIPAELLIDIFSLVPAKSIARFRCVSKLWASILQRHDFIEIFLTKSCTRPRLLFTFEADGKLFFYSTPQLQNPDDNSSLVATPYWSFPKHDLSDICTPACGLVLLHGWRRKLPVICNPATGEFLTLPQVLLNENNLLIAKSNADTEVKEKIAAMYVGYDPMGKHFKVLCMTTTSPHVRDDTHRVLTLGPGKLFWRPVECKFHFVGDCIISNEICINGVLYFGSKVKEVAKIVGFDVRLEKFSFIKTNKDMRSCRYVNSLTLFNYKGRLGILRREDSHGNGIVFWVLEDIAGNHKWSKHIYEPSLLGSNMIRYNSFVGMTGLGELVWSSSHYLTFYNIESETFTKVNIQGFDEFTHQGLYIKTYVDYVENLKSLM